MSYNEDWIDDFNRLSLHNQQRWKHKHKKTQRDKYCIVIKKEVGLLNSNFILSNLLGNDNHIFVNNALEFKIINDKSAKYQEIHQLFLRNKLFVNQIRKVINPFLKRAFLLKKFYHYDNLEPLELYHSTKNKYVDNICTYNFDWRFSGYEKGHRHGKGVNFSKTPVFAAFFGEKTKEKVIIIADVLVGMKAEGKETLVLSPKGSDTATGKNGKIFVKFYDHEFYPKYVVYCRQIR